MTDQPDAKTLDLEEMQCYLILALDDDGDYIVAASSNLSLPTMGAFLGRAQTDLAIQIAGAGAYDAIKKVQSQTPKLVTPGRSGITQ